MAEIDYSKQKSGKLLGYTNIYKKKVDSEQLKVDALNEIQRQLEENEVHKTEKRAREDELFEEVDEWTKQERARYDEMVKLQQKKLEADLQASENYKKMSEIVLKQAEMELEAFKQRQKQTIEEMEAKGVNTIFDEERAKIIREGRKKND